MKNFSIVCLFLMFSFYNNSVQSKEIENETGLPLPRFAALRSNNINARSGPGSRYPIEWIYMQKSAPVEIIAEFELWRKIRDWQGSESWVHKSMLYGDRTFKVVTPGENNLYNEPDYASRVIAKVEDDVVGNIISCPLNRDFCEVSVENIEGWIAKKDIYGIKDNEEIE